MGDYYDIHGNAMSMDQWAEARKSGGAWDTARRMTKVNDDTDVSTVWLGMDHQWGDGPPLIFESMVFGGNLDQKQVRYSTLEQAHAGHDDLVEKVRNEAAAFTELAADQRVRDCVAVIEEVLAEHRAAFDLDDYGDLRAALVKAVTA